jgi:hypothetical protein
VNLQLQLDNAIKNIQLQLDNTTKNIQLPLDNPKKKLQLQLDLTLVATTQSKPFPNQPKSRLIMWGSTPLLTVSTVIITVLHSADVVHIPHE